MLNFQDLSDRLGESVIPHLRCNVLKAKGKRPEHYQNRLEQEVIEGHYIDTFEFSIEDDGVNHLTGDAQMEVDTEKKNILLTSFFPFNFVEGEGERGMGTVTRALMLIKGLEIYGPRISDYSVKHTYASTAFYMHSRAMGLNAGKPLVNSVLNVLGWGRKEKFDQYLAKIINFAKDKRWDHPEFTSSLPSATTP